MVAMKTIPLTRGLVALVDDEDYDLVSQFKWCASQTTPPGKYYAARGIRRGGKPTSILMHNVIMGALYIDHRDNDGLNNQRSNLRRATGTENKQNSRKRSDQCSSRWKGVCWNKKSKKWHATITINRKARSLGTYSDEASAATAYNIMAHHFFGEFALFNRP